MKQEFQLRNYRLDHPDISVFTTSPVRLSVRLLNGNLVDPMCIILILKEGYMRGHELNNRRDSIWVMPIDKNGNFVYFLCDLGIGVSSFRR